MKKYKCVFIDRFGGDNIPINNKILESIKTLDDEFDFEYAVAPRGQIDKQLIEQILNANIVIACIIGIHKHGCDFLNVIYELAFRQGSCKPIVVIVSNDDIGKLPFYLRNTQIIKYNDEEKIKKALYNTKSKPDLPDNRVWEVLNEINSKQIESLRNTFEFYGGRSIWTIDSTKNINVLGTYLGGIAKALREVDNYWYNVEIRILPALSIKMINKEIDNKCMFIWNEKDTEELYKEIHPDDELIKWNGNEKELVNTAEKLIRGTIGFRNDYGENMFSDEIALVRDISVTLIPEDNKIIIWPY